MNAKDWAMILAGMTLLVLVLALAGRVTAKDWEPRRDACQAAGGVLVGGMRATTPPEYRWPGTYEVCIRRDALIMP